MSSQDLEEKADALFNCKKNVLNYLVESNGRIGAGAELKKKVEEQIKKSKT